MTEICRRLDGIALAIELAAARMVSMSPQDVRDRLDDRFRLLSGCRRGLERHQTLRHAVQWSYDLLDDDERGVLRRCSVFADGFDVGCHHGRVTSPTTTTLCWTCWTRWCASRWSPSSGSSGHTRYGMLETIRQFAEDQLAATGTIDRGPGSSCRLLRRADSAHWDIWDGPGQRTAIDWVDAEFANLRAGFRWAADQGDLRVAAVIAAHAASWLAPPAVRAGRVGGGDPRGGHRGRPASTPPPLHRRQSLSVWRAPRRRCRLRPSGRQAGGRSPLRPVRGRMEQHAGGLAHLFGGRIDRQVEICTDLAEPGLRSRRRALRPHVGVAGRWARRRGHGHRRRDRGRGSRLRQPRSGSPGRSAGTGAPSPRPIRFGRWMPFVTASPTPTSTDCRSGRRTSRRTPLGSKRSTESSMRRSRCSTRLINSFHQAGNIVILADTLASLAVFFDRFERPEIAAIIYGASTRQAASAWFRTFPMSSRICAPCSASPPSTSASQPGRPKRSPMPSATRTSRSGWPAVNSPRALWRTPVRAGRPEIRTASARDGDRWSEEQ